MPYKGQGGLLRASERAASNVRDFLHVLQSNISFSHGLKIDSKTGLMVDIDGGFKPYSADSISREYRERLSLQEQPQEVTLRASFLVGKVD